MDFMPSEKWGTWCNYIRELNVHLLYHPNLKVQVFNAELGEEEAEDALFKEVKW